MRSAVNVSERKACKVLKQPRSSQRYEPVPSEEGKALTEDIIAAAGQYGRYGYRRMTALLRRDGRHVNPPQAEEDLTTGRAESTSEATQEGKAVAQ